LFLIYDIQNNSTVFIFFVVLVLQCATATSIGHWSPPLRRTRKVQQCLYVVWTEGPVDEVWSGFCLPVFSCSPYAVSTKSDSDFSYMKMPLTADYYFTLIACTYIYKSRIYMIFWEYIIIKSILQFVSISKLSIELKYEF